MTHVVQFTTLGAFVEDLAGGTVAGIYHELIEQRTATGQHGYSRWLLTTIIRAIVANGTVTRVASLTIPHGRLVERLNDQIIGPFGSEERDAGRWCDARERHELIVDELARQVLSVDLGLGPIRAGIVHVPGDLAFVLARNPLPLVEIERGLMADIAADYSTGGDGSEE